LFTSKKLGQDQRFGGIIGDKQSSGIVRPEQTHKQEKINRAKKKEKI
jgi:hypothetical protein